MIRTLVILAALGGLGWLLWSYELQQATADGDPQPDPGADPTQPQPWSAYTLTPIQAQALAIFQSQSDLDPAGLMAICQIESAWNPAAYRAEPQIGDASYGLMQILAGTAAQMGYGGDPAGLYDPATNITYALAYLNYCRQLLTHRFNGCDWSRLLTAYNEGIGNALAGRTDVAYIARWQAAYAKWQGILAQGVSGG